MDFGYPHHSITPASTWPVFRNLSNTGPEFHEVAHGGPAFQLEEGGYDLKLCDRYVFVFTEHYGIWTLQSSFFLS